MKIFEKLVKQRSKIYEKELKTLIEIPEEIPASISVKNHVYIYNYTEKDIVHIPVVYSVRQDISFPEFLSLVKFFLKNLKYREVSLDVAISSFWQFDNLNIPFYHPDRSFRDTYYLNVVSTDEMLPAISQNCIYPPKIEGSYMSKTVLRSHSTGGMFKTLYKEMIEEKLLFAVGKMFRRQKEDLTHKIEFYQLEINIEKDHANIQDLVDIGYNFLYNLGFKEIRMLRTVYPYTEPSIQYEIKHNEKWMEVGGGGIFYKNISEKVRCSNASRIGYGFGLDRIYMLLYDKTIDLNEI